MTDEKIKAALLKEISIWDKYRKDAAEKSKEYLLRAEIREQEYEHQNRLKYSAMKQAIALLGVNIGIFSKEEYDEIMEDAAF